MQQLDSEKKIIRTRNWFLMSYLTQEEIMDYCKMGHISRFAMIRHDKEDSEPHWHVLVVYHNARTLTAVKSDFANRSQNTLVERVIELDAAFDYLTHARNPEKYQYSADDIICDDVTYWQSVKCGYTPNKAFELVDDIIQGKNPVYLLRKYGREFVINCGKYYQFAMNLGTTDEKEYESIKNRKLAIEEEKRERAVQAIDDYVDFINYEPFEPVQDEFVSYDEQGNMLAKIYN